MVNVMNPHDAPLATFVDFYTRMQNKQHIWTLYLIYHKISNGTLAHLQVKVNIKCRSRVFFFSNALVRIRAQTYAPHLSGTLIMK